MTLLILYLALFSLSVVISPSNPNAPESCQIELWKPVIAFVTAEASGGIVSLFWRTVLLDSLEFDSMMTTRSKEFFRFNIG